MARSGAGAVGRGGGRMPPGYVRTLPVRGVGEVHLLEHRAGVTPASAAEAPKRRATMITFFSPGHGGLHRGGLPGERECLRRTAAAPGVQRRVRVDPQRARIGGLGGDEVDERSVFAAPFGPSSAVTWPGCMVQVQPVEGLGPCRTS